MKDKIQSFFLSAGNLACYAFCIIKLAERILKSDVDVLAALQAGIDKKYLRVNEKNLSSLDNFYVKEPALFLEYLSGWKCGIKKEAADYVPKAGDSFELNGFPNFTVLIFRLYFKSEIKAAGKQRVLFCYYSACKTISGFPVFFFHRGNYHSGFFAGGG